MKILVTGGAGFIGSHTCVELLNAGYEMDFANMDTGELMVATIQAANGVDTYLKDVLREIIKPIEPDFDISM